MSAQVEAVFRKYLPSLQPSGDGNFLTKCPFHKGGQEKKPSFSVHPVKGLFQCFTCHVTGDVGKLLQMLEVPILERRAELAVLEPYLKLAKESRDFEQRHSLVLRDPHKVDYELPDSLMGLYDYEPTTLIEAGFDPDILRRYRIGFDRRLNRIVYPIRNHKGVLIGVSGGTVIPGTHPKYKVYQGGTAVKPGDFGQSFDEKRPGYRCQNHKHLWGLSEFANDLGTKYNCINVVEGFKACLWMIQAGFPNTCALMGSALSHEQKLLFELYSCPVNLFLDNDDAGVKAVDRIAKQLMVPLRGQVNVTLYPELLDGAQPDDFALDYLRTIVGQQISYTRLNSVIHERYK